MSDEDLLITNKYFDIKNNQKTDTIAFEKLQKAKKISSEIYDESPPNFINKEEIVNNVGNNLETVPEDSVGYEQYQTFKINSEFKKKKLEKLY